ncbi:MAG: hypothetical protein R2839_12940 [Thermomicrobiales bacterium]
MKKAWPDPVWFDSAAEFYVHGWKCTTRHGIGNIRRLLQGECTGRQYDVERGSRSGACFGWIDGVGRRIDEERRVIRFTPRRPGATGARSMWPRGELERRGLMRPAL